jgi:hypothetical protein
VVLSGSPQIRNGKYGPEQSILAVFMAVALPAGKKLLLSTIVMCKQRIISPNGEWIFVQLSGQNHQALNGQN